MKYIETAVLTYTKENTQTFFYKVPKNLENKIKLGQLIKVPFRNREIKAVILDITEKKPKFESKEIINIVKEEPILIPHLVKIAKWMSEYCWASLNSIIQTMTPKGVEKKRRKIKESDEKKIPIQPAEKTKKLNQDQQKILNELIKNLNKKTKPQNPEPNTYLIHGITGSGKTEIYLQVINHILKQGKEAIVLVPEVSLTPQTIQRFEKRFPNKVALLHSYLKETERFRNWQEINQGKKSIVVGSRSALFAPLHNLGVIIIDEEHETSYKQEQTPRYNTQTVASKIAEITEAKIILGSATPRIESYWKTANNKYKLFTLPKRIKGLTTPQIQIVDLREEFKKKNKSVFSETLQEEIKKVLEKKKKKSKDPGGQIILFLNRRGTSTFVLCRDCGYVMKCPNCEIPLTFHQTSIRYPWPKQASRLICHHCNFKQDIPTFCPKCKGVAIKYFGTGTQKVEREIKQFFPEAKVLRMDLDTTKKRGSHDAIYNAFLNKNYDILIGTQMITKGWDLPNVELIGVISADTGLNFPDFRSSERTFQLLTQVAGRTGRGKTPGKVIIQTYNPDNFTVKCATKEDYKKFYEEEIKIRKTFYYPPFSNLIKLTYQNENEIKTRNEAEKIYNILDLKIKKQKLQVDLLGPSSCFIPKLKGKYRYQILIKLKDIKNIEKILKNIPKTWLIDIDPINIL